MTGNPEGFYDDLKAISRFQKVKVALKLLCSLLKHRALYGPVFGCSFREIQEDIRAVLYIATV